MSSKASNSKPVPQKQVETVAKPKVTGKFYTASKSSHLLYEAFEIDVQDGVVQSVRCLSRAPDMATSAVGHCSREIWQALRDQTSEDMK